MGFRSYVRQFWGAILMLLRPSLPWCFPIRQLSFEQKEQQQDEKVAKIIIFYGWAIWGCNFDACPSFTAMVFSHPAAVF